MERPIDFSSMTLEELTPIVSMRPGKTYTREELKEARAAFMAALGTSDSGFEETSLESPNADADMPSELLETDAPADIEAPADTENEMPEEAAIEANISLTPPAEDIFAVAETTEAASQSDALSYTEAVSDTEEADIPNAASLPTETASNTEEMPLTEEATIEEEAAPSLSEDPDENTEEEFILKTESRLARFLYILYAYVLLPILAAESLIFLLGSVATAIMVRDVPFTFVHILAAVLYTMIVSIAWHQFLHRTELGLLLNRSLIGVCIFRGFSMILSGTSLMTGIIYIALSLLYLVFFVAYDTTFVMPSQD